MAAFNRQNIGEKAELSACEFLEAKGLRLMMKNYRCYHGEIDLIMQDRDHIVFVEVRSRRDEHYGTALESINARKIKKIIKTANHFLQARQWMNKVNSRFDIITLHLEKQDLKPQWIQNAFWPESSDTF